jgi:hypothetical protein
MKHVATAPHEWSANYLFATDGMDPWFGCHARVQAGDGSQSAAFEHDGDRFVAKLYYQEGGLKAPDVLPSGRPFEMDTVREFRIAVKRSRSEDENQQEKMNAHIRPRWQGMESKGDSANPSVPDALGDEAVSVRVSSSNLEPARICELLERAADAVGVNGHYFAARKAHDLSNVVDAARYVRVDEDVAGPLHARDGPIVQLAHLLEHDRTGYRKLVQNDTDERGRDLPGYYHTVTLDPQRVREAWPSHSFPREVKHYYAREALGMEGSLSHPKLEASYQVSRWDDTLHPVHDDDQIEQELEESILSVLSEAGINLRPADRGREPPEGEERDPFPFVTDAYFDALEHDRGRRLIELDLTAIQSRQESVVIKHLADGMSPVQWESLETLVTDGGRVAPSDIAGEWGRHVDSVRRALREMDGIVERGYAEVSLRSEHVAEMVHEAVNDAQEAVRTAVETTAKATEMAERGIDSTTSAFVAFCARHGIDVNDRRDARLEIRVGDDLNASERENYIKQAFRLWCDAGRDPQAFREAKVKMGELGVSAAHYWIGNSEGSFHVKNW